MEIADFLLNNMSSHHGNLESTLELYLKYYKAWFVSPKKVSEVVDSIERKDGPLIRYTLEYIDDSVAIDKKLLWQYIVDMYEFKNSSVICRKFDNDVFLEYILPYRVGNEPLNLKWKTEAESVLKAIRDSVFLMNNLNVPAAANLAMNYWNRLPFKWTDGLPKGCTLGVKGLTVKAGNCRDFGVGAVYMMRYLGIPSGLDMLFAREGENTSHLWPFILDENGHTFYATQDIPYWTPANQFDLPVTKIYRLTFSENNLHHTDVTSHLDSIHPNFSNNHMVDVTKEYRKVFKIDLPVSGASLNNNSIIYLCNAMRDKWTPVDIGTYEEGKALFKNVASSPNACIVAVWNGKDMNAVSKPFVVDPEGNIQYFSYSKCDVKAHIYCKYPLSSQNGDVVDRMIGGRIEGCNRMDFRDPDVIYTITSSPKRKINRIPVTSAKPYRYIRYIGADSTYCNIAELEIFETGKDENIALGCRIFGTPGDRTGKGTHEYYNVFDGDLYTSFDYKEPSGGWSAVDLKWPRKISEVSYSPRNRDNYIRTGDTYELFYWNDRDCRWNSLGKKTAISDELIYNVPKGALLFLKNHSRGINERVFEYDSMRKLQIFH